MNSSAGVKLYRVFSRRGSEETSAPMPADLKRRAQGTSNGFRENGISVWRGDKVSSSEAIQRVKAGRKTLGKARYGVMECDSHDLLNHGFVVTFGSEHVNIRCRNCDKAPEPQECKGLQSTRCQLDGINSLDELAILLSFFKVVIPI